ncbi:phage holin, LLH family [Chengkuizengella sp. SCS-71B]|uniref:phage holin, LLH family n=1 Tax=Chengkuizengella sp. SCS-71B TaxID=3115290 RepID=UPI0032C243EB
MNELIQPYLETIVFALISVISTLVVAALIELRNKVLFWIQSKTNKEQRELLLKISEEAFSYAEKVFYQSKGPEKLDAAYDYASSKLGSLGIQFTKDEIKATIEKAVLEYNSKVK